MKRTLLQSALLLAVALLATALSVLFHPLRPPWYSGGIPVGQALWKVNPAQAAALIEEGQPVLWIDTRDRESHQAGHLPGAIRLAPAEKSDLLFEHLDLLQAARLDRQSAVVYGDPSAPEEIREIAELLREQVGLDKVYQLEGDWRQLEGSLEK